jgi:hypothetical protein
MTSIAPNITVREERFCHTYLDVGNSCVATEEGVSEIAIAKRLEKPSIFLRIQELRAELSRKSEVTRERIAEELEAIALANPADFLTHDGKTLSVRSMEDLPRHLMRCVKSIKQVDTASGPTIILEFHDKMGAIDRLNKMRGHYQDAKVRVEHTYVLRAPPVAPSTAAWIEDSKDMKTIEHTSDER